MKKTYFLNGLTESLYLEKHLQKATVQNIMIKVMQWMLKRCK